MSTDILAVVLCVCEFIFSLVPMCLGKGQWLARQIQFLQKKRSYIGVLESQSVVNTSEYFSDDESDDSLYTSLDDSVFCTFEDMESDGKSRSFHFSCILCIGIFSNDILYEYLADSPCHFCPLLGNDSPASGRTYCDSPDDLRGRSKVRQQERGRRAISEVSLKPCVIQKL